MKGKIHVFTGDKDTFYLEGAVKLLQADMKSLGSEAEIEIVRDVKSELCRRRQILVAVVVARFAGREEIAGRYGRAAVEIVLDVDGIMELIGGAADAARFIQG